jgi:uncharacterized membrane protein YfcA
VTSSAANPAFATFEAETDAIAVLAMGISFTVSTLALAAVLVADGALPTGVAGASLLALVPAAIGMALGQWLRMRVSPRAFRIAFFAGSLVLGAPSRLARADLSTTEGGYHLQSMIVFGPRPLTVFA